jgi:Ca2+-transporting ATPase
MMIAAFIIGFLLQLAVTEIPFMNEIFSTAPLTIKEWLCITVVCTIPLWCHEILRVIRASARKRKAEGTKTR